MFLQLPHSFIDGNFCLYYRSIKDTLSSHIKWAQTQKFMQALHLHECLTRLQKIVWDAGHMELCCELWSMQHLWSLPIYKGHEDLPTTYKQKHPLGFHSGTWKLCHPKWESLTLEFIIVKVKISDLGRIQRIGKSPCCNFS